MSTCVFNSSENNNNNNNYQLINRILHKFRPIAPKPAGVEPFPDAVQNKVKRTKRKYVRVRTPRKTKRKTRSAPAPAPEKTPGEEGVVTTLQLLPDRSETFDDNISEEKSWTNIVVDQFNRPAEGHVDLDNSRSAVETWIVVESMTDAYMETRLGLGFSDNDKISNLVVDNCPAFVSDEKNNVVWVNEAYKRMVQGEGGVLVKLVVKEKLSLFYPSFACRVRLFQHSNQGQKWNRIIPCDVWRMEFGGFAWKLDVNTALGLGI